MEKEGERRREREGGRKGGRERGEVNADLDYFRQLYRHSPATNPSKASNLISLSCHTLTAGLLDITCLLFTFKLAN